MNPGKYNKLYSLSSNFGYKCAQLFYEDPSKRLAPAAQFRDEKAIKEDGHEYCQSCQGVIYPFSQEDPNHCTCVPDDYEQCGSCGFDHEYEKLEANKYHNQLGQSTTKHHKKEHDETDALIKKYEGK